MDGRLEEKGGAFALEYGVCLQLLDDIQDLKTDLLNQHTTLFTAQTFDAPLDNLTARLWAFLHRVLQPGMCPETPQVSEWKKLVLMNCRLLLLQAVARNQEFFTSRFVQELESVSPLRFAYLATREKGLAKDYASLIPAIRRGAELCCFADVAGRV